MVYNMSEKKALNLKRGEEKNANKKYIKWN